MSRNLAWVGFIALVAVVALVGVHLQPASAAALPLAQHADFGVGLAAMAFAGMTGLNLRPSSRTAVVAVLDPKSLTANTYTTGWIDMQKFKSLLAIVQVGAMGALATVAAKIEQASDSAGTGVKDVTGKSITTLTATASPTVDADNRQAEINLLDTDLDAANSFRYARLSVTTAVAASLVSAVVLGMDPENGPASDNDAASVAQIV
jgi:hypothetical protein